MSANVETMFYVREAPWHGLGTKVMEAPASDLVVEGTVAHTAQVITVFICMILIKNKDKIAPLSEAGVDVKFIIWYKLLCV